MLVTRLGDAPDYQAPGHTLMRTQRLQGKEAGPADSAWIGLSTIEPGGGTWVSAADVEKFYVVVEGRLEVIAQRNNEPPQRTVLERLDSCRLSPGESRQLRNPTNKLCRVLLFVPLA